MEKYCLRGLIYVVTLQGFIHRINSYNYVLNKQCDIEVLKINSNMCK